MHKNTVGLCAKCQEVTGVHDSAAGGKVCNDCDKTATIEYHNHDGTVSISLSDKPASPLQFGGGHQEQTLNDALRELAAKGYNFDDRTEFGVVTGAFE